MGQYRTYLRWFRLKSNSEHLFLKISGRGYLDEQPKTVEEAQVMAEETLEATKEIGEILVQDNRILVITLDLRDISFSELYLTAFLKYTVLAASQGHDIDRVEIRGAGDWWNTLASFLPKYTRDRLVLVSS